jgi:predicted membrane-bound spermidine synthase
MFDVIVVDFPDPTNFSIGKLYTNTFYACWRSACRPAVMR